MKRGIALMTIRGRHLLAIALLLVLTVLSTWADVGVNLLIRSGIEVSEPLSLALFGTALLLLGFLFRPYPSKSDSASADRRR